MKTHRSISRQALVAFAVLLVAALLSLVPQPARADGVGHAGVLKLSTLSDRANVSICRNWSSSPCSGEQRTLYRGQNTKTQFGWNDSDGFYLPAGYNANVTPGTGRITSTGWHKLSGCAGCTRTIDLYTE